MSLSTHSDGSVSIKWRLLASLLPTSGAPVLDCGCGDGGFSRYLTAKGWPTTGIELDPAKADIARHRGIEVLEADLEDSGLWKRLDADYGAVVFSDVLEHLQDPIAVIRASQHVLRPSGGVLISIPNVAFWRVRRDLLLGRWEYADEGILD